MKITFKAKVIADVSDDPTLSHIVHEPSLMHVAKLINDGKCKVEFVASWDSSNEPSLIITEILNKSSN